MNSSAFNALKVAIPAVLISFPLCRQQAMTSLRYASLVGVSAVIFAILVVAVQSFYQITAESWSHILWGRFDSRFFQACGITFFAYICQPSMFPIYDDLANPTHPRISKVVFRATVLDYTMYMLVAFTGYVSALERTQPIVINDPPAGPAFAFLLSIARAAVYVKLAISIPVNFNPLRRTVYDFVFGKKADIEDPR